MLAPIRRFWLRRLVNGDLTLDDETETTLPEAESCSSS